MQSVSALESFRPENSFVSGEDSPQFSVIGPSVSEAHIQPETPAFDEARMQFIISSAHRVTTCRAKQATVRYDAQTMMVETIKVFYKMKMFSST